MNAEDFGKEIKKIRKDKNISAKKLGEKSGISQPYISFIENGTKGIPRPETLKKLSNGLEVSYMDLMSLAGYFNDLENLSHEETVNFVKENLLIEDENELNLSKLMLDVSQGKGITLGQNNKLTSQESKLVAVLINKLAEKLTERREHLSYEDIQSIEGHFDTFLKNISELIEEGDN